jgi:hypothetical protein
LELLKKNIESFFENNLKSIWDIISVEKLKDILRSDLPVFSNLRSIINEIFIMAIKIILKSIKDEGEEV